MNHNGRRVQRPRNHIATRDNKFNKLCSDKNSSKIESNWPAKAHVLVAIWSGELDCRFVWQIATKWPSISRSHIDLFDLAIRCIRNFLLGNGVHFAAKWPFARHLAALTRIYPYSTRVPICSKATFIGRLVKWLPQWRVFGFSVKTVQQTVDEVRRGTLCSRSSQLYR